MTDLESPSREIRYVHAFAEGDLPSPDQVRTVYLDESEEVHPWRSMTKDVLQVILLDFPKVREKVEGVLFK